MHIPNLSSNFFFAFFSLHITMREKNINFDDKKIKKGIFTKTESSQNR